MTEHLNQHFSKLKDNYMQLSHKGTQSQINGEKCVRKVKLNMQIFKNELQR